MWQGYLEGDIDRPVVLAGLYNGQGNQDAPFNQQAGGPSGATGNAAAWFTGNQHAGVLSGFKSQEFQAWLRKCYYGTDAIDDRYPSLVQQQAALDTITGQTKPEDNPYKKTFDRLSVTQPGFFGTKL